VAGVAVKIRDRLRLAWVDAILFVGLVAAVVLGG
jgi:hypothetical protein